MPQPQSLHYSDLSWPQMMPGSSPLACREGRGAPKVTRAIQDIVARSMQCLQKMPALKSPSTSRP